MVSYQAYRKFATIKNGERILIRFPNEHDRESLLKLFRDVPNEEVEFCQEDLKNPEVLDRWIANGNSRQILSLVAVEMKTQPIAALTLYRGEQAALKVGEIKTLFMEFIGFIFAGQLISSSAGKLIIPKLQE